jgi:uncharacterized protein
MGLLVPSGFVALALAAVVALAQPPVPTLRGRVNDDAGILSGDAESRLEDRLAELEQRTGAQVVVLTVPDLGGEDVEGFSLRVAESWALGRQGADDGVLLLVARDDRKARIEVGYGLEGRLTDAQAGRILKNVILPRFKEGDYDGGVERGVDTILGTLEGLDVIPEPAVGEGAVTDLKDRLFGGAIFILVIGVFSLNALFSQGCGSWFLFFFLIPFYALFPTALFGPRAGVICLLVWLTLFPVLKLWLGKTGSGRAFAERFPRSSGWSGGWTSGGSSGGGFSGGGFSGGGGSFGGGGASGSW